MMEKNRWLSAKRQTELVTHYYPVAARKPCTHSPPLLLPSVAFPPPSICSLPLLPPLYSLSLLHSLTTFFFFFNSYSIFVTIIMRSQVQDRFHDFYNAWLCKLEEILQHLLHLSKLTTHHQMLPLNHQHDVLSFQHLVNTTTSHIKHYYTVKWAEAREDVLPFFAPTWLTPLENACSWITGWKPSMVFRLFRGLETAAVFGMSEEQARKIEELRMRMRVEEEKVEREMERLQVAMADHKVVELAKLSSRAAGGGGGGGEVAAGREVEVAVKGVLDGLERTMKGADCVRLKTLKGVLDVLTPLQSVEFLAAVLALQLRLRQCGKKKTDMLHVPRLNEPPQVIS